MRVRCGERERSRGHRSGHRNQSWTNRKTAIGMGGTDILIGYRVLVFAALQKLCWGLGCRARAARGGGGGWGKGEWGEGPPWVSVAELSGKSSRRGL